MALTTDYIFKFSLDLIQKNMAGPFDNEMFERFWHSEQLGYQDDLLGRFQKNNTSKTGANTGLIENETILQKLSPFISRVTLVQDNFGNSYKPTDLAYRLSIMIDDSNCVKINYNQRSAMITSVIDPPSLTTNIYYFIEYADYYEIFPSTASDPVLDYVKTPTYIKWGFTYDNVGRQVYNSGTSVQPLWDNNSCMEITKRMLATIGVSSKDNDFENFGKSVINTGNP